MRSSLSFVLLIADQVLLRAAYAAPMPARHAKYKAHAVLWINLWAIPMFILRMFAVESRDNKIYPVNFSSFSVA
jgi:hypothetical protein